MSVAGPARIDRVELWLVSVPYKSAMRSSRGELGHGEGREQALGHQTRLLPR